MRREREPECRDRSSERWPTGSQGFFMSVSQSAPGRQPQVKLGDPGQGRAGQGGHPRLLRHLLSSDEWRWMGVVPGQP